MHTLWESIKQKSNAVKITRFSEMFVSNQMHNKYETGLALKVITDKQASLIIFVSRNIQQYKHDHEYRWL